MEATMRTTDRIVQLRFANLAQIAAELEERAVVNCPDCRGLGIAPSAPHFCRTCNGTGYNPWPELHAVAKLLAALAGSLPI